MAIAFDDRTSGTAGLGGKTFHARRSAGDSFLDAQKIGLDVKEFAIPTNKSVPLPGMVPQMAEVKVIDYDFAKYGSSETRKRLLERWEKEINDAVK